MRVNPQQLLDDGYIVLRQVVPPDQLEPLRTSFEDMIDRQRVIWAQNRRPEDPPGGNWETSPQPRLAFETLVTPDTANTVEFCLHENTMGISRQIMRAEVASITGFMFMCSPTTDRGPASWHRDIHPIDQAPLGGLEADLLANAPGYLQWNIPLYDDAVLWVVPGSHRRPNTKAENQSLSEDPRKLVPGGIPVELKAGDGVVYTNTILHWGSNYSAKHRRTIHLGYRSFGGPVFPYVNRFYRDRPFTACLSPQAQAAFEDFARLYYAEADVIEATYRSILAKDVDGFLTHLAVLHPGEKQRIVCLILLSKLVYKMKFHTHKNRPGYGGDWSYDEDLLPRFTPEELDLLWQRFVPLDARLQADTEQYTPGFQSGAMRYYFEEMPAGLDVEEFVTSWA
ncbi:MAG: phytanoyl-CoA dioxygenase family protein [candidate division Zixibacteria bacterium]|nr:phytanoyl-CoA dioxygenase family protein [candidate division Zixibacteria bacterium]